jgi:hypothetical protein
MKKVNDQYDKQNTMMEFLDSRKNSVITKVDEIEVKNLFADETLPILDKVSSE